MTKNMSVDVLVVGSGGAGMRAAIAAWESGAQVLILSKGKFGVSGATVMACADVSVDSASICNVLGLAGDREDSQELFYEDIMKGGYGLNQPELVKTFVENAPRRVKEMMDWGAKVRHVAISPGHRYRRAVTIDGADFAHTLMRQVRLREIPVRDYVAALELIVEDNRVRGVFVLDMTTGQCEVIHAKTVVLATGGAMNVYPITTAASDLSGDGMALAYRAGAELVDMEFPMFLLGCCAPDALRGNNYPFVLMCRAGAHLYNREGERFMESWDPVRKEKSSRDTIAVASTAEILAGRTGPNGGVFVSVKHIPRNVFDHYLEWYEGGKEQPGFHPRKFLPDLMDYGIEATPSAHFWNGGIRIDANGETTVRGLLAAGECTGGMHGANRLSGNAMSEILIWGEIAGRRAAELSRLPEFAEGNPKFETETLAGAGMADAGMADAVSSVQEICSELRKRYTACFRHGTGRSTVPDTGRTTAPDTGELPEPETNSQADVVMLRRRLQDVALRRIGPMREEAGLLEAKQVAAQVRSDLQRVELHDSSRIYNREWLEWIDLSNMCDVVEMTAEAALARNESLSCHYRRDAQGVPTEEPYNIYVRRISGVARAERRMHLPAGMRIQSKAADQNKEGRRGEQD